MVALADNPFAILGVSVRAKREQISEAYQDALLDGEYDETVLARAQQALTTPRPRLEAEISWLADMAPARARQLVGQLERGGAGDPASIVAGLDPWQSANILADLCQREAGNITLVSALIEAHGQLRERDVASSLNDMRALSGFGPVSPEKVREVLGRLVDRHADAAVTSVLAASDREMVAAGLVQRFVEGVPGERAILDRIVDAYDVATASDLAAISERIDGAVAALRERTTDAASLQTIESMLRQWDEISQPVQLREQAKGLDEPRSKALFERLRELCLWLANEKDAYEPALRISKIVHEVFPELPSVIELVEDDISTLEDLVAKARAEKALTPLISIHEGMKRDSSRLAASLLKSGFSASSDGAAGQLFAAFMKALDSVQNTSQSELPWHVVRAIALVLNNEDDQPSAAQALLKGMLAVRHPIPTKFRQAANEDLRTITQNLDFADLRQALDGGRLDDAASRADLMLRTASAEDRPALLRIKEAIAARRQQKVKRWLGWGVAAAILIAIVANDEGSNSTNYAVDTAATDYAADYAAMDATATDTTSMDAAAGADAYSVDAATAMDESTGSGAGSSFGGENMPPVGRGLTLDLTQIRYCRSQNARLEAARPLVGDDALDGFNTAIDDYNARCGEFYYRGNEVAIADAEVISNSSRLQSEGEALVEEWR